MTRVPGLHVLAGVNGAGKSSLAGAAVRRHGGEYFNPDEAARRLRAADPSLGIPAANALAWRQGVRLLRRAIDEGLDYSFETTLGGSTITRHLAEAAAGGHAVHVLYVGLDSPERHLRRVRARVRKGGHDIPEADIRRRFEHSRLNLVELMPRLATLRVYDNSREADPAAGRIPKPVLLLEMRAGRLIGPQQLDATPAWARPVVAAALALEAAARRRAAG